MLVELAVGDAYGAGFEYAPREFVARYNTLEGYVRHPTHLGIAPGAYTDDTQMTLAIAELMVDGTAWTPLVLADKFVEVYHRDRRDGYAGGFQRFLESVSSGAEFLRHIRPDSDKSGAAMRAGPIGLLSTVAQVREHAALQARVTHDTPAGVAAAEAAALAVHYCHFELGPVADVARWVDGELGGGWSRPWQGKVGSAGSMSVRAALTALTGAASLGGLLRECVAFTGDVDTVATVALAAGARSPQLEYDLDGPLLRHLENGRYGRGYLHKLNRALLSAVAPEVLDPGQLHGRWADDHLYLGAMEAAAVRFNPDGTGHHELANVAGAAEITPFTWALEGPGRIRIDDEVRPVRLGRGTTATNRKTTVLTLGDEYFEAT